MARIKGDVQTSVRLEPKFKGTLDARCKVGTFADLLLPGSWEDNENKNWLDASLLIAVTNDSADKNGFYHLISDGADYTVASNWKKMNTGSGGGSSGATLRLLINGVQTNSYDTSTDVSFDVTLADLGGLSINHIAEGNNFEIVDNGDGTYTFNVKLPDGLKTISVTSATVTNTDAFTLVANQEIVRRIDLNSAALQITDSNFAQNIVGGSILYSIKNITSAAAVVTFPANTGYEYMWGITSVSIPAGKSLEVGITAVGASKRSLTHATMDFTI